MSAADGMVERSLRNMGAIVYDDRALDDAQMHQPADCPSAKDVDFSAGVSMATLGVSLIAALLNIVVPSNGPASSAPVAPCALLTQAQVNAALGVTAGPGQGSAKLCRWGEPGAAGARKAVVVTLQDAQAFAFAKAPSSGIGDDAVYVTITGVTSTLTVKKGDVYFEVHVYGLADAETKAVEKTIALDVITKLQ
jgi:hypothetical protein